MLTFTSFILYREGHGIFCIYFIPGTIIPVRPSTTTLYDHSASTECKSVPEDSLYNGGIITKQSFVMPINSTAFILKNLTGNTIYAFSSWVKITGAESGLITATLTTDDVIFNCTGTVVAKSGCWSFLKGGFDLDSPLDNARIYFNIDNEQQINVSVSGASIQPFTHQEWENNQQYIINKERKRNTVLHVMDVDGKRLPNATVEVKQIASEFPFGTTISEFILGNLPYQRFNTAVFENELKWPWIEPEPGKVNYTIPDQMLQFLRTNQITVRGHNVFWESANMVPPWVKNLTTSDLRSAVRSRIESVMGRYRNEFIHWDVNNEILPNKFYEQRLGPGTSSGFYREAQRLDPSARMFMNEYNTLENCDGRCAVDKYVARLREIMENGATNAGIGLQSHFYVPNRALIRGVLDKFGTLKLPIWLTEVDISKKLGPQLQAKYLEVVLREGFSHPSVEGIMLWTALNRDGTGCYRMCLTDYEFKNLPSGDTVDKLLKAWQTREVKGKTDCQGNFNFSAFLAEYEVKVTYENRTTTTRLSLGRGYETKHWNIYL